MRITCFSASEKIVSTVRICLLTTALGLAGPAAIAAEAIDSIQVNQQDLQQVIDAAPSHAVVQCDPKRVMTLSAPVTIRKPLTLVGLHARLPDKLGKTPLIVVEAKG